MALRELATWLNENSFASAVETSPNENLLTAIHKVETDLASPRTTIEQKTIALKFLVHLVGDAHQTMHVSRSEDKGGNTIQVQFDGKGTNLHSLWDSKLIDKQGLTDEAFEKKIDTASLARSLTGKVLPRSPGCMKVTRVLGSLQ